MKCTLLLLLALCARSIHADSLNPVFWERSFTMDISQPNSQGTLIQSTSNMATSQDFQGIHIDSNPRNAPDRIIFNFGECCKSSNITMDTIRQINHNSINATSIEYAQKIALVKRGNCNWNEKLTVVNNLALANNISITAMFIYDNDTHNNDNNNITIALKPVVGSGSISPPEYSTPLPENRSVMNMTDNDLGITSPSTTVVYFVPNVYGTTFVDRINQSYNASVPNMRTFWLITPYLEEVSWGYAGGDSFFSTGKGYLSYIIALAAIFLIGVIFLRWWRIRRMGAGYPNGYTGFQGGNGLHMQPRASHIDPLPVDIVNALPIDKYSPDLIKNINCAICLEDFVPGKNDIRILPCGHGFCVLCIDPWLTQKSTVCPICKWDCLPTDLRRDRNQQQHEQEQQHQQGQHQQQQGEAATGDHDHAHATAIDMSNATPSASVTPPQVAHVARITGSIIPPPILPASSPPPSPRITDRNMAPTDEESPFDKDDSTPHLPAHHLNKFDQANDESEKPDLNPFDGSSSIISEAQIHHSAESSTPAHVSVEMKDETKPTSKGQQN
ncbi:uncharacterized protein ATC70_009821 [Mucor velutinosus]|uniref:RING-type domain-containing protein n=1 Tax=Mucor velutinosus TaxID=708070 RepID=A0AAN7DRH1_9FUNG|nr:hypothetical protein ATC70_009821 [Mucor velutinosus]